VLATAFIIIPAPFLSIFCRPAQAATTFCGGTTHFRDFSMGAGIHPHPGTGPIADRFWGAFVPEISLPACKRAAYARLAWALVPPATLELASIMARVCGSWLVMMVVFKVLYKIR
jgi:hypothetical protein